MRFNVEGVADAARTDRKGCDDGIVNDRELETMAGVETIIPHFALARTFW